MASWRAPAPTGSTSSTPSDSWRRCAGLWSGVNEGIVLASAAGAVGVQLGGSPAPALAVDRSKTFSGEGQTDTTASAGSTPGAVPQPGHLRSVVGLIWRSVDILLEGTPPHLDLDEIREALKELSTLAPDDEPPRIRKPEPEVEPTDIFPAPDRLM